MDRQKALDLVRGWFNRARGGADPVADKTLGSIVQTLFSLTQDTVPVTPQNMAKDMSLDSLEGMVAQIRPEHLAEFLNKFPQP